MSEYPNIVLDAPGVVNVPGELRQKERITTHIFTFAADASKYVARQISDLIRTSTKPKVVLGLATGSTPTGKHFKPRSRYFALNQIFFYLPNSLVFYTQILYA
jgi:hypothetical protein